jgi:hypothetical protein
MGARRFEVVELNAEHRAQVDLVQHVSTLTLGLT